MSHPTQYRSFRGRPFQAKCTQTQNNIIMSCTKEMCNKTKFAKKYAMLKLSLDVACDVIGYLRNVAVKSTKSK